MSSAPMKVGQLAKQTGVSIRTLHHYDEIGLLKPSHRTEAGHRLYTPGDIARLQQIKSLQHLGLSLAEVREWLDRSDYSPLRVIEIHLDRLDEKMDLQRQLRRCLETLAARYRQEEALTVEEVTETIREVMMMEGYYTPEQRAQLEKRGQMLGEERIREAEAEWRELFVALEAEMKKGAEPDAESVKPLGRKACSLIDEFTGSDPGIRQSLGNMYRQEGPSKVLGAHGFKFDPAVFEFLQKAMLAVRDESKG